MSETVQQSPQQQHRRGPGHAARVRPAQAPVAAAASGLTRRVLRSRLMGALTYPHGVDRYVELVQPLALREGVRARVVAVRRQTERSVTVELRPNDNWRGIRAGQFVGLSVQVGGVLLTRQYSPAGPDSGATIELTISTHPDGRLSGHLREHARVGMVVDLTQAQGEFVLPDPRPERVLLVSGGSGITPVMAMLRTLCAERYEGEIGFLNYARSAELALYGRELAELAAHNPRLQVARGYTRAGDSPLSGRFRREHLAAVGVSDVDPATFVCGPPALIDAVTALRAEEGLAAPLAETFTAPAFALDTSAAGGTVSFARSGLTASNSGLPLLEQAEDAGLAPEHGCRMGICNTCSCRKRSGAVRNLLTGEVSRRSDEDIRICVSVPAGDVELEL